MAQTREGRVRQFCRKNKIEYSFHVSQRNKGLKWCVGCKEWHLKDEFGKDATRYDELSASCLKYRRITLKKRYKPISRVSKKGIRFASIRDGDKKQARARVNHLVQLGFLPAPNILPCKDCGHIYKKGERRHEYDHYMGYLKQYQETVEAVCTTCHSKRTIKNGSNNRNILD